MFRKFIDRYYKFQTYVNIGWGELSWFSDSLVEMMAIIYILERVGVIIEGDTVYALLLGAFIGFFFFGLLLKKIGVYDRSEYVEAEIDPVSKINLEASKLIIKQFGERDEKN